SGRALVVVLISPFLSLGVEAAAAASRGRVSGGDGRGKQASRGTGCTEPPPLRGGGGSWAEACLGERRGNAPRPPSGRVCGQKALRAKDRHRMAGTLLPAARGAAPERSEGERVEPGPATRGRAHIGRKWPTAARSVLPAKGIAAKPSSAGRSANVSTNRERTAMEY